MTHAITKPTLAALTQALGSDNVSTDLAERELFSQDIWAKGETADFVISPKNTQDLSDAVKLAARDGVALNPRGGGMSYTKGYTPSRSKVGILDFTKMNKVLEVNVEDMYVTVQAGCTWETLHEALKPLGVRTPFWGPLSGLTSTIGGGLSQNNAFFGAGTHGPSSDSVTCLTVVLADGSIVKTGSAGTKNGKPFWRQYGPDLTGLFLSDAGALGYKAEATLRLIPTPPSEGWASFDFTSRDSWAKSQADMGRLGLACEIFGFDPNLTRVRMTRAGLAADVKSLKNVITGQKGLLKGLKEGAKVAMAGRGYMDKVAYSLHIVVEGHSDAEVEAKIKTIKEIAKANDGKEIENSIPKIIRSNPFAPLNSMIGPHGERWVPIHGIVPMSEGQETLAEIDALFESMRSEFDAHDILTGYLITMLLNNGFLIEPVFIWPEEIFEIHKVSIEKSVLNRTTKFAPNPEATTAVVKGRQGVLDIFSKHGAGHFQIGRTYPYKEGREEATWDLIEKIKTAVDPDGSINPGALGLG